MWKLINDNTMKKIIILFSLLFLALQPTTAQNTKNQKNMTNQSQTEKEIAEVVRSVTRLMIERNVDELESLLDKNFTLTHITGRVQSKADWLEEIRTESMKYYGFEEVQMTVKIDGNTATVTNRNLLDARIWGSRNKWRLQQVFTLENRNGKWIPMKSVATTY